LCIVFPFLALAHHVQGTRKLRPCLSYRRRRDRINLGLIRSYDKGKWGTKGSKYTQRRREVSASWIVAFGTRWVYPWPVLDIFLVGLCLVRSLPALSLVISPFTVRSGPLDSWTLSGQACIPVSGQPHVVRADCWPRSAHNTLDTCWTLGLRTQWVQAPVRRL
jgi:hypothetical protein